MRGCSSPQINTALTIPRVRGNPREREEEEGGGRGRREREEGEGTCWPEPQELEGRLCSKDRMDMSVSLAF